MEPVDPSVTGAPPFKERRKAEQMRARQQAAIASFGLQALRARDVQDMLDGAVKVIAEVLEVEMCGFLEAVDRGFLFRAGVGWRDGTIGAVIPPEPDSAIEYMVNHGEPVLYDDLPHETRFTPPPLLLDYGVRGGAGVVVYGREGLIGVMGLHTTKQRMFTQDDANFMQAIANVLAEAITRSRVEEKVRDAYEKEHEAAQQLRALDEMKNTFLQAVSHELRTPLASILGLALTLEQSIDKLSREDRDRILERLGANARELDRLLGDLLDLDRLLRRAIEPNLQATEILRLVRTVAEGVAEQVTVEGEDVVALVDAPKVERIVDNLIRNAVKHTPAGTRIWARVERAHDGVMLRVEDDGPGIPDDLKEAVFEPLRLGPSASVHAPGAGIGLSLVARFAELHGGRAWVQDRDGGGASIRVWLPTGEREAERESA